VKGPGARVLGPGIPPCGSGGSGGSGGSAGIEGTGPPLRAGLLMKTGTKCTFGSSGSLIVCFREVKARKSPFPDFLLSFAGGLEAKFAVRRAVVCGRVRRDL